MRYPPIVEMYGAAQSAQVCPPGGLKILNSRSLHCMTRRDGKPLTVDHGEDRGTYDDREIVKFIRDQTIHDVGEWIQSVKPYSEELWHDVGRDRDAAEEREDNLARPEKGSLVSIGLKLWSSEPTYEQERIRHRSRVDRRSECSDGLTTIERKAREHQQSRWPKRSQTEQAYRVTAKSSTRKTVR